MACYLTGPAWGKYFVGPLQFAICYGAVVACTLLGGQSLKVSNFSALIVDLYSLIKQFDLFLFFLNVASLY